MTSEFSDEALLEVLSGLPRADSYRIAFSGGLDSTVLLHSVARLRVRLGTPIAAIHIDHGIHADSAAWAAHCAQTCAAIDVSMKTVRIDARPVSGHSPEAHARRLRYEAIGDCLGTNELLLTAHHLDDQMETLFIQLLRGAGPAGLSGMPALRALGRGLHARPLLQFTRAALLDYAQAQSLDWIEDLSNSDTGFDRNFLRHEVLPRLLQRWPAAAHSAGRAARHQAEASVLLDELAQMDMEHCHAPESRTLRVSALGQLSPARRGNVIRYWLRSMQLPVPGSSHLRQIQEEVIAARADAEPCVGWEGAQVRRFRDHLVAIASLPGHDPDTRLLWRMEKPCTLVHGRLSADRTRGAGIRVADVRDATVEVRYRAGGEKIRLPGRAHRHALKELLRESGVPGWWRESIPLLFLQGRLAAVAGMWVDADFCAAPDEEGWRISWTGISDIPQIRS